MDTAYQEFQNYLSIQNPKVISNLDEIIATTLDYPFMLHIDRTTPTAFIPRIGTSFSDNEDRTLPRITVSDSILGCIVGYYRFLKDFLEIDDDSSNGYYINVLDFDYCVRPNAKLVPYGEYANEHWLLGYNKATTKYKPRTVGKLFISSLEHIMHDKDNKHCIRCTFFIEITEDIKILFSKDKELKLGYYKIVGDLTDYVECNDVKGLDSINHYDLDLFKVTRIPKEDYRVVKRLSAVMLDTASVAVPIYEKW